MWRKNSKFGYISFSMTEWKLEVFKKKKKEKVLKVAISWAIDEEGWLIKKANWQRKFIDEESLNWGDWWRKLIDEGSWLTKKVNW